MARQRAKSESEVPPAEADERERLARAALAERKDEIVDQAGGPAGGAGGAGSESPDKPGAAPRDPAVDAGHLSSVVECAVAAGARLVAWKWPRTALFIGGTLLPKVPAFAQHVGQSIGPAAGLKFPRALPAVGGVCSLVAVFILRQLPPPAPPPPEVPEEKQPAQPQGFELGAS